MRAILKILTGAALAGLSLLAAPTAAAERITDYAVEIAVQADGVLRVTERITVNAEGENIRRGIFRDFPTVRGRTWWGTFRTSFDVASVERNGKAEPFFTEKIPDGVRLYIGDADVRLDHGLHTYTITYSSDRQIGFFDDRDEVYWNVTGHFWAFPIAQASAAVRLPDSVEILETDVFTGPVGATAKNAAISVQGRTVTARTTQPLDSGEGLTIGIAFTPGIIARPAFSERAAYLLRDNIKAVTGVCGLIVLLAYYLIVWSRYGRDPEAGSIVPEYAPPKGLSPAACRYVLDMGWHKKAFTAALVSLGAKGYATMGEVKGGFLKDGHFFLTRTKLGEAEANLSAGETQMAKALFKSWDSIPFTPEHRSTIIEAQRKLQAALGKEFDSVYFVLNRGALVPGFLISLLTAAAMALSADDPAVAGVGLLGAALLAGLVAALVFRTLQMVRIAATFLRRFLFVAPRAVILLAASIGTPAFLMSELARTFDAIDFVLMAIMAMTNVAFFYLMEAPTRLGRTVMSHIAGFRHYLTVAEKDRLNFHNPPDLTPEVFEAYLPYAIALDVEHQWGEQFDAATARLTTAPEHRYAGPRWYRGEGRTIERMSALGPSLEGALASSIATATAPPSSGGKSGGGFSKGGGFSGGGGGGGGGGGW